MDKPTGKPRNLFRLAGVLNAANTESDLEAGELIARVQKNKARTLDLIIKGHKNETLRESMLSEAEKEHALADLEAAIGDNGGPLLEDHPDESEARIRAALLEAKSDHTSKSSETPEDTPEERERRGLPPYEKPQLEAAPSPPEVGQQPQPFQP